MSLKYTSKPIKISSNLWDLQMQMPTNTNTNTNRGIGGVKLQIGRGANTAGLLQRRVLSAASADICKQVKSPLCETVMICSIFLIIIIIHFSTCCPRPALLGTHQIHHDPQSSLDLQCCSPEYVLDFVFTNWNSSVKHQFTLYIWFPNI